MIVNHHNRAGRTFLKIVYDEILIHKIQVKEIKFQIKI